MRGLRCSVERLGRLHEAIRRQGVRAAWRAADHRGQIAVVFLVLIALMILLASATMNLGEVARLKTSTANAVDAGALAGASWVASGTNEAAFIARALWINAILVQLLLFVWGPLWCWVLPWFYPIAIVGLAAIIAVMFAGIADVIMDSAYDDAKGSALFTTIQNLSIDDRSGTVRDQLDVLAKDYENGVVRDEITLGPWMRKGADGVERPSEIWIRVRFSNPHAPTFSLYNLSPFWICLSPPIKIGYIQCAWHITAVIGLTALQRPQEPAGGGTWKEGGSWADAEAPGDLGMSSGLPIPSWSSLVGFFKFMANPTVRGDCETCFPFPVSMPFPILPRRVNNGQGDVIVTVRHTRNKDVAGTPLDFWRMQYPRSGITSRGTARYTPAKLSMPSTSGKANLQSGGML